MRDIKTSNRYRDYEGREKSVLTDLIRSRKKILIVEDNSINRQILGKILGEEHTIIEAENGQAALARLKEHREDISLILLDIIMPIMDGYTFLSIIKDHPVYSSIPVIITTSNDSEEDEIKALANGAADFIRKPYRMQITRQRVNNIIHLRETAAMMNLIKYDQLTGVYSKEYFYKLADEIVHQNPDKKYDIICSDIENFSLINDMFSYTIGNEVLQLTTSVLRSSFGDDVLCGRINADTFAVFIERIGQYEEDFFEKTIAMLNDLFGRCRLQLDFGIYHIEDSDTDMNTACDRAMAAIETIKGKFTRTFAVYDDALRKEKLYSQAITDNMEKALIDREFLLHYQPKYNLRTQQVVGAEALVRWLSPTEGLRLPNLFIPLFEQNGFITELDKYVWNEACAFIRDCLDNGIECVPLSVNVSRADLYNPNLPDILTTIIKRHRLDPGHLHLEITESAYTEHPEMIIDMVSQLRNLGFVIEMDDFGTGYSSLSMLSTMPIDVLKLDMKFVQSNTLKSSEKNTLNFVIDLAKWMNLEIIAEGVEYEEQAIRLRDMSCDQAQGYYFSRPIATAEFRQLLIHRTR